MEEAEEIISEIQVRLCENKTSNDVITNFWEHFDGNDKIYDEVTSEVWRDRLPTLREEIVWEEIFVRKESANDK